jgi:hypothetical protein
MSERSIEVVIGIDGKVRVELLGYQGRECDQETLLQEISRLLSGGDETPKDEYYQSVGQEQQQGL